MLRYLFHGKKCLLLLSSVLVLPHLSVSFSASFSKKSHFKSNFLHTHVAEGDCCTGCAEDALLHAAPVPTGKRDGWREFSIAGTSLAVSGGGWSHSPSSCLSLWPPFSEGTLFLFFYSCMSCTKCMCIKMIGSACFISDDSPIDFQ